MREWTKILENRSQRAPRPGRNDNVLATAASAQSDEPGCRPDMASLRLPIHRANLTLANLGKDEARITFVGHATS